MTSLSLEPCSRDTDRKRRHATRKTVADRQSDEKTVVTNPRAVLCAAVRKGAGWKVGRCAGVG